MNIAPNAAPGGQDRPATSARYTSRAVLQAAADARQSAIDGTVADALASDRLKPDDMTKDMARTQVQALIERVQILKKLYAGNPREMAQALAQVFRELKAALKAYQQATGDELGMAGDLAGGAVNAAQTSPAPAATPADTDPQAAANSPGTATDASDAPAQVQAAAPPPPTEPADMDSTAKTADDAQSAPPDSQADAAPAATASTGASTYAAVTQGLREAFGRDDQSFISDVRGLAQALSDILASARIQAKAAKPDKATAKAFEDADKQYASLEHALDDADRDLRNAVPTLGLRLSIAA